MTEVALPLKIRRDGQRLFEILPAHQPVRVLNSLPLEFNHQPHYLQIVTMFVSEFNLPAFCVYL